jgi:hypothetical protein
MLCELNEGKHHFVTEIDLNDDLLRADLERIYLIATSRFQNQLATYLTQEGDRGGASVDYELILSM